MLGLLIFIPYRGIMAPTRSWAHNERNRAMNGHQHHHDTTATLAPEPDTHHDVHADVPGSIPTAEVERHVDHEAMEHGSHAGHRGHGGMAHDMSDPAMAAAMERDMRRRFFAALVLTIPTALYSSLG